MTDRPEKMWLHVNAAGLPPSEVTKLREMFHRVEFRDPAERLRNMRPHLSAPGKGAVPLVGKPRDAKKLLEEIDAALFAYGFGSMYGLKTLYTMREERDGDALMCAYDDEDFGVSRVQVKSVQDAALSGASLNDEIAKLGPRYPTSSDLIVVVALHMSMRDPLKGLDIPKLNLRELYLLVAADEALERWQLVGDLLAPGTKVGFEEFKYPS